jgi:hypothetical protein
MLDKDGHMPGLPLKKRSRSRAEKMSKLMGGARKDSMAQLRGTACTPLQTPAYYQNPPKENKQWTLLN